MSQHRPFSINITRYIPRFDVLTLVALLMLVLSGCDLLSGSSDDDEDPDPVAGTEAPPPATLSAEEVEAELATLKAAGEKFMHSEEEFDFIIQGLSNARSDQERNQLTVAALAALEHLSDRVNNKEELRRNLIQANREAGDSPGPSTKGDIGVNQCNITFDTPSILDSFEEDAEYTFTKPSYKWWEQPCGQGRLQVSSTFYNHYHLSYEDPNLELCALIDPDIPGFGRVNDQNECIPVDPTAEPRKLAPHWGNDIIVIRRLSENATVMTFSLNGFTNAFSNPVEVRYKTADGDWFGWSSLAGYTIWNLSDYAKNVVEVHISHFNAVPDCGLDWITTSGGCSQETGPISVDDIVISI